MPCLKQPVYRFAVSLLYIACFVIVSCNKDFKEKSALTAINSDDAKALADKPNVIIFLADDVGYDVPSFTGGQSYSTPNLDFMAANGTFFMHAYSHPDGFPSRLALMTGKYNFRNYTFFGNFPLPAGEKTIGNMMEDAGYATCYVGRWNMNRGDVGIRTEGFQKYRAWQVFTGENQRQGRYKDPIIYQDSAYLPESQTKGRFSEDMYSDYLDSFIHDNKTKPFFAVYAMPSGAAPYVPAPNHPDFAGWNPSVDDRRREDAKYFPSLISYMDQTIGKVINKVKEEGLANNTVIMFMADNSTQERITSKWKNPAKPNGGVYSIEGHKTQTDMFGTLTPLVVYWPGTVAAGKRDQSLVDYTDIMPTLADIAKIPTPKNYGTLDGVSFYDNMTGTNGKDRKWVFCHWDGTPSAPPPRQRFIWNAQYKLYDTTNYPFFNIKKDTFETHNIPVSEMTRAEKAFRDSAIKICNSLHEKY